MKKLILLAFIFIGIKSIGQVDVVGYLRAKGNGVFPTNIDSLGKGGFRICKDTIERNNITFLRRKYGMLVYCINDDITYQLKDSVGLNNWAVFTSSSTTGSGGDTTLYIYSDSINLDYAFDTITNLPISNAIAGDKYLVGINPPPTIIGNQNPFYQQNNNIALYVGPGPYDYTFTQPTPGQLAGNYSNDQIYRFTGTKWVATSLIYHSGGDRWGINQIIGPKDNKILWLQTNNIKRLGISGTGVLSFLGSKFKMNKYQDLTANPAIKHIAYFDDSGFLDTAWERQLSAQGPYLNLGADGVITFHPEYLSGSGGAIPGIYTVLNQSEDFAGYASMNLNGFGLDISANPTYSSLFKINANGTGNAYGFMGDGNADNNGTAVKWNDETGEVDIDATVLFISPLSDGSGTPMMVTETNGVLGYAAIPSGGGGNPTLQDVVTNSVNAGGNPSAVYNTTGFSTMHFQTYDGLGSSSTLDLYKNETDLIVGDGTNTNYIVVQPGLIHLNSSNNQYNIQGVTYAMPESDAAGVLTSDGSGNLSWGLGSGSIPDLQTVLTAGFNTTLAAQFNSSSSSSYIYSGGVNVDNITNGAESQLRSNYIKFTDQDGNVVSIYPYLTSNQELYLPNFTGTLATSVTLNGTNHVADANGLIDLGTGSGSGSSLANIGSGYRLAIPNTGNVKTLYCTGCLIDSTSHTNALTIISNSGVNYDAFGNNYVGVTSGISNAGTLLSSHNVVIGNQAGNVGAATVGAITVIGDLAYRTSSLTGTASNSVAFGNGAANNVAGINSSYNTFLGNNAGQFSNNVNYTISIGNGSGSTDSATTGAIFIGNYAGTNVNSSYSNFIGYSSGSGAGGNTTGKRTHLTDYSNYIGFNAGYFFATDTLLTNNIVLGTNISLPNNSINAMNIGGAIFGTGFYSTTSGNPSITAISTSKIGIGTVIPGNRLEIANNSALATGKSGLRLNINSSTTTLGTAPNVLGVDANGDVGIYTTPSGGSGSSGTVTNVATGWGLLGGPITSTGTIINDSATLSTYYVRLKDSLKIYATPKEIYDSLFSHFGVVTNNAIPYYNSSGQLTSGNVLTFNGSSLGIGNASIGNGGGANFGISGSLVSILTPVNLGYSRRWDIDQPNMKIVGKNGNADNGAGIMRPTQNGGELRIFSNNTNTGGATPGYITFYVSDGTLQGGYFDGTGYLHSSPATLATTDSTDIVATTKWVKQLSGYAGTSSITQLSTYIGDSVTNYITSNKAVFVGDSWTSGGKTLPTSLRWSTKVANDINMLELNFGIAGTTMSQETTGDSAAINRLWTAGHPDASYKALFIAYGINDARHGINDTTQFKTDYTNYVNTAITNGYTANQIYMVGSGFWLAGPTTTSKGPIYSGVIKRLAAILGTNYIDVYDSMVNKAGIGMALLDPVDSLHPNNRGHQIIANDVLGVYRSVTSLRTAKDLVVTGSTTTQSLNLSPSNSGNVTPAITSFIDASAGREISRFYVANGNPLFGFYRANGTLQAPTILNSGDQIFSIDARGYDGTTYLNTASIRAVASGTLTAGSLPTRLDLLTGDGSVSPTSALTLNSDGSFTLGKAGGGASTITGSTVTVTGSLIGTYQSNATITSSNFAVGNTNAAVSVTGSALTVLSASTMYYRNLIRGSGAGLPTANTSYGSLLIGTEAVTVPSSGTNALFAQQIIKPLSITTGSGTLTNSASLFIEGAATGATNNYSMWIAGGLTRFDGNAIFASSTVPTLPSGYFAFWLDTSSGNVKVTKNVAGTTTTQTVF